MITDRGEIACSAKEFTLSFKSNNAAVATTRPEMTRFNVRLLSDGLLGSAGFHQKSDRFAPTFSPGKGQSRQAVLRLHPRVGTVFE